MVSIRKPKTALKFESPSGWWGSMWREALPAGNGVIGAAVFGGVGSETVLINHADLSWQGHISVLPDVLDKLKEVRDKLDENKSRLAQEIYPKAMIAKNYRPLPAVPLPLCDFNVKTPITVPVKEYMRVLNMENGEISVTYKDGTTRFDRSLFVSRENDSIIYEINRSGSKPIDAEFSLNMHDRSNNRTPTAVSKVPEGVMTRYESYFMYFSAISDNGTEFGAVAKIQYYGGSQEVGANSIKIKGANNILVVIKPFIESQREKEWKRLRAELAAMKDNYDKMLKGHSQLHSRLLNSMELDLDASDRDATVESLIRRAQAGELPAALIEKMWLFGRYLLVSSTAGKGRPVTPYGLWCGDYKAAAPVLSGFSGFHEVYNHTFAGNLSETVLPIFNYYEGVSDDLKKNAMRLYGCRGIFVPAINSPGTGLPGSADPSIINFTGVGGIVGNLYYNYALFNDDSKFLKTRALPFMREVALFYEDFFKLGKDGFYISSPSYSPNTNPGNFAVEGEDARVEIAINATVDFAIAKELLTNLIAGSLSSGLNKNDVAKWQDMLTKIPKYEINSDKVVKEYLSPKFNDNYNSEKISHLYAAYPGTEINTLSTDSELPRAFINAAKKRLSNGIKEQTSSSLGNIASLFARLGEGDAAADCLSMILRSAVMSNMVTAENDWRGMGIGRDTAWASYHIQGNMIFANVVQDMLLASTEKTIKIFPSFYDGWNKLDVSGMQTRAGVEVGLSYKEKSGSLIITLKAKRSTKIDLHFPAGTKRIVRGVNIEGFNLEQLVLSGVELSTKPTVFEVKYTPAARKF